MTKFTNPLSNLKVASPCEENWETMLGNERKRYCGRCELNVYNLSGMTKVEAENLLANSEGRLCVRFYQRADGSVITQDCPVGWAKIKNRTKVLATAAFSLILTLFSGLLFASFFSKSKSLGNTLPSIFSPEPEMGAISISENTDKEPVKNIYPMTMGNISVTPERRETMGKPALPIKEETRRKVLAQNN